MGWNEDLMNEGTNYTEIDEWFEETGEDAYLEAQYEDQFYFNDDSVDDFDAPMDWDESDDPNWDLDAADAHLGLDKWDE